MIKAPEFWWRERSLAALCLAPVSWVYGAVGAFRMRRNPDYRADVPVICVGNFTIGGAGKTPTAIAIAGMLKRLGKSPMFLTRGYGGSLNGPVAVDPKAHRSGEVGDEALLLARTAPAIVASDRVAGAKLAAKCGADVIVMDDGFQNPSIKKSFSLVVVDAKIGIGNRRVFPAGPLRAPVNTQLAMTDAILLIGSGLAAGPIGLAASAHGIATQSARLVAKNAKEFAGRRVFAFAGIGRPEKFFESLDECGAEIAERRSFPDHHKFSDAEADALIADAERAALTLVTTAKDHMRLSTARSKACRGLAEHSDVLEIECVFDDEAEIETLITGALNRF